MKSSAEIVEIIKNFEGLRTTAYSCPGGYKTIGYGHKLPANSLCNEISIEEAAALLLDDIREVEKSVQRNINIMLKQSQFDALVSFTFNVGSASLQRSTLRQKINRQEHAQVPGEFMRWIYSGGRILPGLVNRREIEADIYAS